MTYDKCEFDGCIAAAQFVPEIFIPAMYYPVDLRDWPSMIINLKLCKHHAETFDAKSFVEQDAIKMPMRLAYQMNGGNLRPDFDRAFVHIVPLDSHRYMQYLKARK